MSAITEAERDRQVQTRCGIHHAIRVLHDSKLPMVYPGECRICKTVFQSSDDAVNPNLHKELCWYRYLSETSSALYTDRRRAERAEKRHVELIASVDRHAEQHAADQKCIADLGAANQRLVDAANHQLEENETADKRIAKLEEEKERWRGHAMNADAEGSLLAEKIKELEAKFASESVCHGDECRINKIAELEAQIKCQTCKWGTIECDLHLERSPTGVCDPGDWLTPEGDLKDCWEPPDDEDQAQPGAGVDIVAHQQEGRA